MDSTDRYEVEVFESKAATVAHMRSNIAYFFSPHPTCPRADFDEAKKQELERLSKLDDEAFLQLVCDFENGWADKHCRYLHLEEKQVRTLAHSVYTREEN